MAGFARYISIFCAAALSACSQDAPPEPAAPDAPPAPPAAQTPAPSDTGIAELDKLLDALGGAAALNGIETVSLTSDVLRWELDEHFMPEDVDSSSMSYSSAGYYDAASDSLRLDVTRNRAVGEQSASYIIAGQLGAISGQDGMFAPPGDVPMASDRWAAARREAALLNPHIAYREALTSADVTVVGDAMVDGDLHHVLAVDSTIAPLHFYVNADTGDLSRLRTKETENMRRDVMIEVTYDDWRMSDGGVAYPADVAFSLDRERVHEETRTSFAVNEALAPGLFDFPEGVTPTYDADLAAWGMGGHHIIQMMANVGFPYADTGGQVQVTELAPGVHHMTGSTHHSMVVEQADGLVVAEAPMHELRSEAVIDAIGDALPGQSITHILATHYHTDHSAGMRTYIAEGATAVVHESARRFFEEIFTRPSTLRPDALERNPRSATIETVPADGMYTIADDERAVEIYPLPNDHAADMVLIYVRGPGVVFVSDIYSPNPNAPAGPGGQAVQDVIEAQGLEVSVIAGGHGGAIDYATFQSLL
jgi:glyoxylase-like metal-dependent hydrolase (beta-lactamase superfamily II)